MEHVAMKRSSAEIAAEVAVALVKGPRTLYGVAMMVCGDVRHSRIARRYIDQFKASGLVRIGGWKTVPIRAPIYEWQSVPFALPDVEPPVPVTVGAYEGP
jgi:hypothetical protein